jgi:hypothetical protein
MALAAAQDRPKAERGRRLFGSMLFKGECLIG